ncbi:hypothetical protein H0E87_022439 [Populus deltoides]|uniref:Malectin-like domain-containing protein n=1 Tax=Populus deltoides TaxID=3696 RepID=A0A8T2XM08_POPDE|nr:hypothetical protein H0E87_022439 [Populus deltoides]
MSVDHGFSYLIRTHFCDVASQALKDLYFNVYINCLMGVSGLDLSSINNALSTAYYTDFVLNVPSIKSGSIRIQMSNYVGSLDGLFGVDGSSEGHRMKIVAGVGLAMVVTALLLLAIVYIRWPKGPQDWEKQNSRFSSWPFPLRTSHCSFLC